MTEFEHYLVGEHIEDYQARLISRRELLRRVTLITGSTASAVLLLEVAGCSSKPSGTLPSPQSRQTSTPYPFATPPAQPTTDGVTVRPDDSRITVAPMTVTGADGASLISYSAQPSTGAAAGGVLVVHENRGLVVHIEDVVRRVATAGFSAVSVDLLSRQGGARKLSDPAEYAAALSKQDPAMMVSDLQQALAALSAAGADDRLGITGFCFGGGMTWNVLAAGTKVKAAVPFYGPPPKNLTGLATTSAAVFAVYAERDTRITSSKDEIEQQLRRTGHPYRITVYPGVDHAFHNDTGPRYNATQAEAAWVATIEWFQHYVP
ncbi:MAG TPA: dienelactone hydrolase family protein [Pseudonocardiaceae bacterium]|nr:dienelactone hydrolase family protein [Pseudonocardiaceae bacterium]